VEFSVAIAARNESASVGALLDSICRASYGRHRLHEVLVYDDASTDATASIVEAQAAKYPEIRLVRGEQRVGCTPAMDRLYQYASGDAVVRLSADLAVESGAIEQLLDAIDAGAAIAIGANKPVLTRVTPVSRASTFSYAVVARLKAGPYREHYAVGNFVAYRRGMMADIRVPRDVINDDHYMAARIVERGGRVVDVASARCRLKPSETTTDYWRTSRRILEGERQLRRRYGIGSSPLSAKLSAITLCALRDPLGGICWTVLYCWSCLKRSPTVDSAWPASESSKGAIA
jgi:glycosyltransferase involved in cell wall biosynthesis